MMTFPNALFGFVVCLVLAACGSGGSSAVDAGSAQEDAAAGAREDGGSAGQTPLGKGDASAPAAQACANGKQDATELDVDCGGPCRPCADGKACNDNEDCPAESYCVSLRDSVPESCRSPVPSCYPNPCAQDEECHTMGAWSRVDDSLVKIVACFALPAQDQECAASTDDAKPACAAGLKCISNTCQPPTLEEDDACDLNRDACKGALKCFPNGMAGTGGICGVRRALGEICGFGSDCELGLRCDRPGAQSGSCAPRLKQGETCKVSVFNYDCEVGLICSNQECVPIDGIRREDSEF